VLKAASAERGATLKTPGNDTGATASALSNNSSLSFSPGRKPVNSMPILRPDRAIISRPSPRIETGSPISMK